MAELFAAADLLQLDELTAQPMNFFSSDMAECPQTEGSLGDQR